MKWRRHLPAKNPIWNVIPPYVYSFYFFVSMNKRIDTSFIFTLLIPLIFNKFKSKNKNIKRVVIETIGVWRHDDTTSRSYDVTSFCDSHWSNLRFTGLFFQNALVDHSGVYTDTNNQGCYVAPPLDQLTPYDS